MQKLAIAFAALLIAGPALAETPEASLYHYRAVVTDVHDGDTVTVDLDLGFHVWVRGEHIRLAGVDAPELNGDTYAQGEASGNFLRDLLLNKSVIIETIKDTRGDDKQEKYGTDVMNKARKPVLLWSV
jgi:endonuclease YncB( thermonuclease family)